MHWKWAWWEDATSFIQKKRMYPDIWMRRLQIETINNLVWKNTSTASCSESAWFIQLCHQRSLSAHVKQVTDTNTPGSLSRPACAEELLNEADVSELDCADASFTGFSGRSGTHKQARSAPGNKPDRHDHRLPGNHRNLLTLCHLLHFDIIS